MAWGAWREPPQAPDIPADPRHRALHKALTHNAVRVRERRGALVGVRVLDLGRSLARGGQAAVAHDQPPARRASPVPHLRSGHFRRVRVGPRASFHYEIRWIPPVWVQGDTDRAAERLVVRRLPPPATWSQAPSRQPRPAIVGDERAFPTGPAADRPPPHDHDLRQGPHDDPFDIDIP